MATIKVILAGYEGSKKILSASSYLINKYLKGFDVYFLNYGDYNGQLFCGTYISLDTEQKDGTNSWSKYIADYLRRLEDEYIIFALDDYLLSNPVDLSDIDYRGYDCVKLCSGSDINDKEYSCTTQYTIWKREFLIDVLEQVKTPWEFEIEGSKYINKLNKNIILIPAMTYPDCSALSSKWEGVRLIGNENDIEEINKLL